MLDVGIFHIFIKLNVVSTRSLDPPIVISTSEIQDQINDILVVVKKGFTKISSIIIFLLPYFLID